MGHESMFVDMEADVNVEKITKEEKTILEEAMDIIYGQRKTDYGTALKNMQDTADLWSVQLQTKVTWQQVVQCMIQVKMARLVTSPNHRDSYVDIAGYAGVYDKAHRGE